MNPETPWNERKLVCPSCGVVCSIPKAHGKNSATFTCIRCDAVWGLSKLGPADTPVDEAWKLIDETEMEIPILPEPHGKRRY